MAKKYIPNLKRTGVSIKQKTIDAARRDGYNMAVLAGAAVLYDVNGFSEADMADWMDNINILIGSISEKTDNPRYIIRELEKLTDIKITFSGDEDGFSQ